MTDVNATTPPPQLWIPGPTYVRPEILAECMLPMIGHRSAEMTALIERLDPGLRFAFGAAEGRSGTVAAASTSASGLMESALRGVGPRTLSVVSGAFGKRWLQIAQSLGKDAAAFEVEWGKPFDDDQLADVLDRQGPFDALTVVSNETSTGTRTDLRRIHEILQAFPNTLYLVDVVSLIAGAPVDVDGLLIDFALAGVQKALACPPGIGVFCVSDEYLESAREQENRGWFLDPVRLVEGHVHRSTPATPCIPLYRALAKQLDDIGAGVTLPVDGASGEAAWTARFEVHERMRDRTLAWAAGHGFEPFPTRELASPTVSCLRAGSTDVAAFTQGLRERGYQISNGYGPLKGETFRIGHMGDHTEAELEELLAAADEVLR